MLVRNWNSDVKSFFCQQVDVWTLLKITEKIIQRNVFLTKEKETGLSADRPSNIYCASKTKKDGDNQNMQPHVHCPGQSGRSVW